jgi:Xaa-Pro aminopeptidase
MREYQLQAALEEVFHSGGARRPAYESIVGSGDNATILHYRENDGEMRGGELVLIDAGAELDYMAADITRTFPVDGRFTEPQRKLYGLVLNAHRAAIESVRPGRTLADVHEAAFSVIRDGLIELGWIDEASPQEEHDRAVRRYFMHRTSHYLGMDVHDVGPHQRDGQPLALEPGVVITVEPGLYVSRDDPVAPEEFWSTGIRIEDDVLVSPDGATILTSSVPREIDEIEALMAEGSGRSSR